MTYVDVRGVWPVLVVAGVRAIELRGADRSISVEDARLLAWSWGWL